MTGRDLARLLGQHRFDVFTGVPCSLIQSLIAALDGEAAYLPAVREDVAVGLAAGAWLAGRRPVVLMQNSGLGTSLNALASLSLMYGLPALLLVTWRGHAGQDAPEHILMGQITRPLLDLLGIPSRVLGRDAEEAVAWAAGEIEATGRPVALLIPPGLLAGGEREHLDPGASSMLVSPATGDGPLSPRLSRLAAMTAAMKPLGREPVVAANGYISREACAIADRPQNFYMIGSMGLASAIALGLSLGRPGRPVVVLDGDGNLLMSLGTLPMVAALGARRLVHCVFDNEVYGSTGNQRSLSRHVRLDRVAAAAGYRTAAAVTGAPEISAAVESALGGVGPHFVLAKVTAEEADVPRIPYAPTAIRDRFRAAVAAT